MQPITYLILAALLALQTPKVDIVAPADPAIKVLHVGAGSFSPVTLSLLPYTFVLQNNSTHDITGLAVIWQPVGGKPQTLLADSYTTKRPIASANGGYAYLRPNQTDPVETDPTTGRLVGSANKDLDSAPRVIITVDAVLFDDGTLIGRNKSGLVDSFKGRTELADAEAKWMAKKPQAYEFTYAQICLCRSPGEPIVFRVINGVGSSIKGIIYAREFDTVEKLFGFIRQELAKQPRRAYLEYDPDDGHPTSVRFNDRELASDTDYGFTITNFTPLFPPLPPPFQPPPGRGPNGSPATATGQKGK